MFRRDRFGNFEGSREVAYSFEQTRVVLVRIAIVTVDTVIHRIFSFDAGFLVAIVSERPESCGGR